MKIALAGVICGLALAQGLSHFVSGLLYDVKANDPVTFAFVAALLIVTALLACGVPAVKASRLDPTIALRHE